MAQRWFYTVKTGWQATSGLQPAENERQAKAITPNRYRFLSDGLPTTAGGNRAVKHKTL